MLIQNLIGERRMNRKTLYTLFSLIMVSVMMLSACGTGEITDAPVEPVAPEPAEPAAPAEPVASDDVSCEPGLIGTEPMHEVKDLRVNLGTFPDLIDPQKSSFVNEIAHFMSFAIIFPLFPSIDSPLHGYKYAILREYCHIYKNPSKEG